MMVPQTVLHQSSFRSLIPMAILIEVVFLLHGDVCSDERGKNLPDEDVSTTSLVPFDKVLKADLVDSSMISFLNEKSYACGKRQVT